MRSVIGGRSRQEQCERLKIILPDVVLRQPEVRDADRLYRFRNDPEVVLLLGGFSTGYSEKDILEWFEFHSKKLGGRLDNRYG
jgi:RimJ/RimL family protein N-acetyltransferase